MKKWFVDLKIKHKLNIIMFIGLISLIFLGIFSHFLLNTSHVVSFILNGERVHNVAYHSSIQFFYKYLETKDKQDLDNAYVFLDKAILFTEIFGTLDKLSAAKTNEEFANILFDTYSEFLNERKNAELLRSRIDLLLFINNKQLKTAIATAARGIDNGKKVKEIIGQYVASPNAETLIVLEKSIDQMFVLEEEFARSIDAINQYAKSLLFLGLIFATAVLGGVIILLIRYISVNITVPSYRLLELVKKFAVGDLSTEIEIQSKDEMGQLAASILDMKKSMEQIVAHANKIAQGNYTAKLSPRSGKDELINSLNEMTESLKQTTEENRKQNWLKTGLTDLNDRMRGEQDAVALAQSSISYIAEYLNSQVGAIYLNVNENKFKLVGSYAYSKRKKLSNEYKRGEGVIGQAALEKKPILISNVPDDYIKISSGLGESIPKNILAMPFMYEHEVKGVIELGSFEEFGAKTMEFLKQATENIGINFNSAESRSKLQELLEKTQQQAEELQSQQEELRQTNEELEEQAKYLRESESKLQAQQEELRQTNEELEEKTQSLQEQKDAIRKKNVELEHAQHLLEDRAQELEITSKYKSEFLANMSHELRTPLNSLLILSKILSQNKETNLTEKQVEFAQTIHAAGTELLNIINEILDLAKVESGKMELHIEPLNLKTIISDIQKNYKHLVEESGLTFSINLEEGLPDCVHTDEQRLKQIVKNFISNAIKFTEKGSVKVNIGRPGKDINFSHSGLSHDKAFVISVTDTGKGILKDKQKVIFEAFQQEDGTTSRKYGGTGLGLSIARELARLLGGEIQLVSDIGKGSAFSLYFRDFDDMEFKMPKPTPTAHNLLGQQHQALESLETQKRIKHTAAPVVELSDDRNKLASGDRKILIIEDDVKFAKILIDLARERNFKCLIAQDGRTGIQMAEEYKPEAIILDIGLPDIDGWTVMEKLKDNSNIRHIPVHFMSASDKSMEAMRMGAIGFLTKPVSMEGLEEAFVRIEEIILKTIKNLLVVEDDEFQRKSIIELIGNNDVHTTAVAGGKEAFELLKTNKFDCMVLDLGLADISGFELLQVIESEKAISHIPIIIYTGREISRQEEAKLTKYAESIIIKGVKSPDRLFDEVTLFLHRIEANLPEEKQKLLRMIHDKEMLFHNKKILLVDDDMRNVFALSNVLEEKGMKVTIGKNGKEGLDLLERNGGFDLVLMDIMMPEMDGYEAMRHIRKNNRFSRLPIIALTAKAMKGDRNKCIEAGASDYLSKPVDPDKLLSLLRVWLYQ